MTYFLLWCKSLWIRRLKEDLIDEKINAIHTGYIGDDDRIPQRRKLTIRQKIKHCCIYSKYKIKQRVQSWVNVDSKYYQFFYKLKRSGSFENFILKSITGFLFGFFLTYLLFLLLIIQMNYKLTTATILCSFLGCILMLGLAFSWRIRCIVFLILPQFFSKRGRQVLLTYAFILAITGPSKNTINNMTILNESLACGQEQLKSVVRQILDTIRKPFYAIRDAIKTVVKTVKYVIKKIKEILIKIKRLIVAILNVIKSAFQFLGRILNICNKELGTPFERCTNAFSNAIIDCNAKLGPLFNWLCSITYLVQSVCYIVKIFDYVCMLIDFFNDSIIGVVAKKIKTFIRHIRTIFYVRIKFSHSFHFETNQTKSYKDITKDIAGEIEERTRTLLLLFDCFTTFTSFFLTMIIIKAIYYRYRFLTSDRFDNVYILKDFRIIDLQRAKHKKETVLPLNHRESQQYVKISSVKLAKIEKTRLGKAIMTLLTAAVKLATYIIIDYSLYWIMDMISYYGRFQSKTDLPNMPTVHVNGTNLFADLLRAIINAFRPFGTEIEIDTVPCLPIPIPPDYDRYIQILILLIMCAILTFLEPYGLRLRNWLMCYYEPFRSRQRTIWLYNHILRRRLTFLKLTRRRLRRKFMLNKNKLENVTFLDFLHDRFWFLRFCLPSTIDKQRACLLCGTVFHNEKEIKENGIQCQTPGCPGFFCKLCFNDLKNRCPVCLSPVEYNDLSDISEEKGSPDSDDETTESLKGKQRYRLKIFKKRKYDEENPLIDSDDENIGLLKGKKRYPLKTFKKTNYDEENPLIDSDDETVESLKGRQRYPLKTFKKTHYDEENPLIDNDKENTTATTTSSDYSYQYERPQINRAKQLNKAVSTSDRKDASTSMTGIYITPKI